MGRRTGEGQLGSNRLSRTTESIKAYVEEKADTWLTPYSKESDPWFRYNNTRYRLNHALNLLRRSAKGRVVDLGCGAGYSLLPLKNLGFADVIGVDISDAMVAQARRVLADADNPENISILQGDVRSLDMIPDQSVDACMALGVIEYLNDDDSLMSEIRRILKPGGLAVIQTRNADCIFTRSKEALSGMARRSAPERIYREHTVSELEGEAVHNDLRMIATRFSHFYVLFPFTLIPGVRKILRPIDNVLGKRAEVFAGLGTSRYLASMSIVLFQKNDSDEKRSAE